MRETKYFSHENLYLMDSLFGTPSWNGKPGTSRPRLDERQNVYPIRPARKAGFVNNK
jgi:hypothetical protein